MNTEIKFIDIKTRINFANNWDEGQRIVDLTPDHNRELILMDLDFLIRLLELLPTTSDAWLLSQFKINLKKKITNSHSLEDIIKACEDFTSFHRTIDLIEKHKIDTSCEGNRGGSNKCDVAAKKKRSAVEQEVYNNSRKNESQTPLAC